jgi:hypothetical protein
MEDPFERKETPRWVVPAALLWILAVPALLLLGRPWILFLFLFLTAAGLAVYQAVRARARRPKEEPDRETAEWVEDQAGWE